MKWDTNAQSLAFDYLPGEALPVPPRRAFPFGEIICTAKVREFRLLTEADSYAAKIECGNPYMPRWGLILTDIKPLIPSVSATGRRGIWYRDESDLFPLKQV